LKAREGGTEYGFDMNEEPVVNQADEENLAYVVSDEALETAGGNVSFPAWSNVCTPWALCVPAVT
jgi:hypothetical protein